MSLRCAYINARSYRNKTTSIHDFILSNNIDLLAITEKWLGTDIDDTIICQLLPTVYLFLHCPRTSGQRGGGVGLVYRADLSVKIDQDVANDSYTQFDFLNCSIRERGV